MFYCRDYELQNLNKQYSKNNFECIIIYGRRRVGKTALINQFCKDKPAIFFSALNASSQENLEALSKAIYEKLLSFLVLLYCKTYQPSVRVILTVFTIL
ncbi:hypothetical protein D1155_11430 [Anaerotruncus sp. 80]|uniref:ATPase domain-containing protein n=1 Tax=Anaerotruncus colihominis TaxID=169435 RepID=A0A845QMG2_9FIRM|nr:ATP-binding protein [Senimuribacter intestinalis]MCI9640613.1 hypothetical protein [Emergencia sp.]NBH62261.1 hypothetical protein [Anaerotruncus colihominis]NCE99032.1 hypothetical protein [Emergencia sp. 1XD21-10]NCF02916.1 hypothetical protein [Anaerotruncus sp. 80]